MPHQMYILNSSLICKKKVLRQTAINFPIGSAFSVLPHLHSPPLLELHATRASHEQACGEGVGQVGDLIGCPLFFEIIM
jgi:hypothetical protein